MWFFRAIEGWLAYWIRFIVSSGKLNSKYPLLFLNMREQFLFTGHNNRPNGFANLHFETSASTVPIAIDLSPRTSRSSQIVLSVAGLSDEGRKNSRFNRKNSLCMRWKSRRWSPSRYIRSWGSSGRGLRTSGLGHKVDIHVDVMKRSWRRKDRPGNIQGLLTDVHIIQDVGDGLLDICHHVFGRGHEGSAEVRGLWAWREDRGRSSGYRQLPRKSRRSHLETSGIGDYSTVLYWSPIYLPVWFIPKVAIRVRGHRQKPLIVKVILVSKFFRRLDGHVTRKTHLRIPISSSEGNPD